MDSGTKPKKAAVPLLLLAPGLVSVATNAGYTRLGRWAASNEFSIKACLCALTASPLELHSFLAPHSGVEQDLEISVFID
jgi:hypothetical protein